jgi:hypothetical protein
MTFTELTCTDNDTPFYLTGRKLHYHYECSYLRENRGFGYGYPSPEAAGKMWSMFSSLPLAKSLPFGDHLRPQT